ncbi:MAG: hypothetical protein KA955_05150 [Prevotella sp.]|nr:hypothetical protein [Prevotella sp.]
MKNIYLLIVFASFILLGCKTTSTASFVSYETECLGVELDGSQTLRAWGEGRNKADAVEQAEKNAVRDVIFKGIRAGKADCNMRPLITEVNAQEKYEEYFNRFFMDNGEYRKYVSSEDEKNHSKEHQKNYVGAKYGVTVRVLRAELKSRLKNDGVLQ